MKNAHIHLCPAAGQRFIKIRDPSGGQETAAGLAVGIGSLLFEVKDILQNDLIIFHAHYL